jgi:hypothetical protein
MSGGLSGLNMPRPKAPLLPPALANYLATHPLDTELLARPEVEQLLVGLNSGNISVENILQQLSNPVLQVGWRRSGLGLHFSYIAVEEERPLALSSQVEEDGSPCSWQRFSRTFSSPSSTPSTPQNTSPQMILCCSSPKVLLPAESPPLCSPTLHPLHTCLSPQQACVPSPQEMTVLT